MFLRQVVQFLSCAYWLLCFRELFMTSSAVTAMYVKVLALG
jgi:hypothetical protein